VKRRVARSLIAGFVVGLSLRPVPAVGDEPARREQHYENPILSLLLLPVTLLTRMVSVFEPDDSKPSRGATPRPGDRPAE
jgi:hypothetical protein